MGVSSAGNTRGLIEATRRRLTHGRSRARLPRGIPAASLKPEGIPDAVAETEGLPRGIPAASLKQRDSGVKRFLHHCLPRGIPAASLKRGVLPRGPGSAGRSSAGNTRGLIEAPAPLPLPSRPAASSAGNTRGLIEASASPAWRRGRRRSSAGNTRGLIEAAGTSHEGGIPAPGLPRGIPAASLKRIICFP